MYGSKSGNMSDRYQPIYDWKFGFRLSSLPDKRKVFAPLVMQGSRKIPACIGYGVTSREAEEDAFRKFNSPAVARPILPPDKDTKEQIVPNLPPRERVLNALAGSWYKTLSAIAKKSKLPIGEVDSVVKELMANGFLSRLAPTGKKREPGFRLRTRVRPQPKTGD